MPYRSGSLVFVVDDEPIIASSLAVILQMHGFSAKFFTSPLEALIAARAKCPDLLLSVSALTTAVCAMRHIGSLHPLNLFRRQSSPMRIAMAPLPLSILAGEFAAAVVFGVVLDGSKIPIFARLGIA